MWVDRRLKGAETETKRRGGEAATNNITSWGTLMIFADFLPLPNAVFECRLHTKEKGSWIPKVQTPFDPRFSRVKGRFVAAAGTNVDRGSSTEQAK